MPFSKNDPNINRDGRPPRKSYSTIRWEALVELAKVNNKTPEEMEVMLHTKALTQALKGEYQFYKDDTDRIHGKATDKLELSGSVEANVSLSIEAIKEAEKLLKTKKTNG